MSELSEQLRAEEAELRFDDFALDDAWELGCGMRAAAADADLPVAIGIVLGEQRVFHTALPGSSADNDDWLARKTRVALRYGQASLTVGESFRERGGDFDVDSRLDPSLYAAAGGVVPIRLKGGAVIGVVGVSGLPQLDDHAFVVEQLRAFLAAR
ncbi:MAG TPA: heme-degrading domain-containing protein [Propionicimonas sp.]|nr:heme-degrading domain-containing protein [Propionicimonas sp.]HRA06383.1 heme-degrading domain-containing protein [Propionicimonas sp.]